MPLLPPISVKTVVLCCAWYLVLSVTAQLTRVILVKFTYPFLISLVQFLISAVLSYSFIRSCQKIPKLHRAFPPGTIPQDPSAHIFSRDPLLKVLPLGLLQSLGKYFSLCATLIVPVATVASVKALLPLLIVAGYRVLYRVRFPLLTYLLLMPLLAGVVMMIMVDSDVESADTENHLFLPKLDEEHIRGLLFCVVSALLMAAQQIYSKELITWDAQVVTNPASLVLNTDPSRPTTPTPAYELPAITTDSGNSRLLLLPSQFAKQFTQRKENVRLPYSVSDLRLDEKNTYLKPPTPYMVQAQENRAANNPVAALVNTAAAKPDKLTVIFFISVVGGCFSASGFLVNEAAPLVSSIYNPSLFHGTPSSRLDLFALLVLVVLNAMCHFCQLLISYLLLGSIPALSYSVASMLKRIVIIVVSILFAVESTMVHSPDKWFGRVSTQQVEGLVLIGVGLYCYDRWGLRSMKQRS